MMRMGDHRGWVVWTLAVAFGACGDDGGTTEGGASASASATMGTDDATATATDTDSTSMGTTDSTSASTSDSTTATGTGTDTDTTAGCVCTPGETSDCADDDNLLTCADDCMGFDPVPCPQDQLCFNGSCADLVCIPGSTSCDGPDGYLECNDAGDAWEGPIPCTETQVCEFNECEELCSLIQTSPSSIGCSFLANRMLNLSNQGDSLVLGNISQNKTANAILYQADGQGNEVQIDQAQVPPADAHVFLLDPPMMAKQSMIRQGGSFRVETDIPVVAYQHSPINAVAHNDSSMLLPEYAQRANYVVASYKPAPTVVDHRSYFNVIALEDATTVEWTPQINTAAGPNVPAVNAGQTGSVMLDRFDTLQVVAPSDAFDITGAFVSADNPIWVMGASICSFVPENSYACDHLEEQMLPLDYWGETYVGAHAPTRNNELYYWRIFGGEDGVTITTTPPQPGSPYTLDKGEWTEFAASDSFMFEGDGPFLPVQYLASTNAGAGTGDPGMYQMVPVEQFLDAYAFVTGTGYNPNYVQVIREVGGGDVLVDGQVVAGYYTVGNYEVSDWQIAQGTHFAQSTNPFGIIQIGYTNVTSYAYPGGMKLEPINPQ